jgi:hypothetical protein
MGTERNPRSQPLRPGAGQTPIIRQRIPLPPLPQFRRPAPDARPASSAPAESRPAPPAPTGATQRGLSPEEAALILGEDLGVGSSALPSGPEHEGRPSAGLTDAVPKRTGASGAAVMNDLVDEIERDLEREIARLQPDAALPTYRRALGCSLAPGAPPAGGDIEGS